MYHLFGVDIDNRLKFNEHVSNVCTKASQRVGVLMRMKNMIPMHKGEVAVI